MALLWPPRRSVLERPGAQSIEDGLRVRCATAASSTDRAPWMSSVLKYDIALLADAPKRRRSPEECSREVRPSQLAKCRPEGKRWTSTTRPQRGGGERPDTGDLQQPLHDCVFTLRRAELALDLRAALLELRDLLQEARAGIGCRTSGRAIVGVSSSARALGRIARCAPTGTTMPNSRRQPRSELMREVRVRIHCDRSRCSCCRAC